MRKIRRGFPRHMLPLLALRVEPCGKSVDNFGTPRCRSLPWVKGMDDVSRKTEGIQPLKGPELTRNSVSLHVSCGSHGGFEGGVQIQMDRFHMKPAPIARSAQNVLGAARTGATRLCHLAGAVATSHPNYKKKHKKQKTWRKMAPRRPGTLVRVASNAVTSLFSYLYNLCGYHFTAASTLRIRGTSRSIPNSSHSPLPFQKNKKC